MSPEIISRYSVVRRLGAGGMGEVYLAQDTELERRVALKVMSAELAKDPNQRKRFRSEAKAASGLSHPHICVIHEVGETEDGRPFLAMEYIDGLTLDIVLQRRRLTIQEAIRLGIDVSEALEAAHARGLVHRDIKPGNLMLNRDGDVKVLDFGLAKRFTSDELSSNATSSAAHTKTGMLIGTPQYMSPEQALGHEVDPRSDIFSLGVVLYEILAGQRPFLGSSVGEVINNIINQQPEPLGLENPQFSPVIDQVIWKCLEKDRDKRYASARELKADLVKLRDESEGRISTGAHTSPTPLKTIAIAQAGWVAGKGKRVSPAVASVLVAALILGIGAWAFFNTGKSRRAPVVAAPATPKAAVQAVSPKSVAVLPFVNMSPEADEYLSDGMTEELLNALTKVKGLRVPGRSSSFAFKGKTEQGIFKKVGEQLGVETVLEGSVRKAGNQLRITAQLISVADGFHLWSETYDRDMTNIFAIQSDIAARVAEALKVQLLGATSEPTRSIEAYQLYLKGRSAWSRRSGKDVTKAVELFNAAAAQDPLFALAYAGLANCYIVLTEYAGTPATETLPKARAAALQALELDSTLAEPHATIAYTKAFLDWDWAGAEAEFQQAIAMHPNYATARHWYGILLEIQGRYNEALAQYRKAQEVEPLSQIISANLAYQMFLVGQKEQAIEALKRQVEFDPSFAPARNILAGAYLAYGKFEDAIRELEMLRKIAPAGEVSLECLGTAYVRASRTNDAQEILAVLLKLQSEGRDSRTRIAILQHALGDDAAALDTLEKALAEHAFGLDWLNADPNLRGLRSHPRAQAILKQMNLVK